jgi:hypothetical protein
MHPGIGVRSDALGSGRRCHPTVGQSRCRSREAWSDRLGSFTQSYGSSQLDASVLLLPQVGFLPPDDPRVRGTLEAVQRELSCEGFLLRYRTEEAIDGLPVGEGTFLPCSFWLVDALALDGRHDEAVKLFEIAVHDERVDDGSMRTFHDAEPDLGQVSALAVAKSNNPGHG